MFHVHDQVVIHAPAERCFGLSTNLAVVERTLKMHPAAGRTSGSVKDGDTVLWKGWQFGLPQFHESEICYLEQNRFFQDHMLRGRFATFAHDHSFTDQGNGSTLLRDDVRFSLPFGAAGWAVGRMVVLPHVRTLVRERFQLLKELAEGDGWKQYLVEAAA